jgi:hypothetical protein
VIVGKLRFCVKLLQYPYYQGRGKMAVVREFNAVLLVTDYRGNGGLREVTAVLLVPG